MPRSKTKIYVQPNEFTCGPSSLKIALRMLDIQVSHKLLINLCKTTRNGTSTVNMIKAANKLGLSVLSVKKSTLTHLQSALKTKPGQNRAVIVDYIDSDHDSKDDTGHFAAVAGYSARSSRIILFDSYTGTKKTFLWTDFLNLWRGYEYKRIKNVNSSRYLSLYKRWQNRHMLILSKNPGILTPNSRRRTNPSICQKNPLLSPLVHSFPNFIRRFRA